MKINKILLFIAIAASVLRLWNLANIPPHLTPDEAALGYNAYSILKTGKDEHGATLPIVFKSFGDYKPGLYVYATVPFVALLDLNEWSVRLPSAIAGILAVILIYGIVVKIFDNKKLGLTASFVLAFSPWHINFSRGAWEINLALTLTLFGVWFFLKALENKKYLFLSALFFGTTFLTYQGAKLSTAVVILALALAYFSKIKSFGIKNIATAGIVGLVVSLPIIVGLFQGQGGRLSVFSVFSNARPPQYLQDFLDQGSENVGDVSYYLFHSENVNWVRGILGRWFNHFSGRFLFFEGDWANPRHSSPNHGMLLLSDLVILVLGVFVLANVKNARAGKIFIAVWLILAPLSAALSRDQVHAVRTFNMVIPFSIIIAFGLYKVIESSKIICLVFAGIFVVSFIYFLDSYFVHVPAHQSKLWEYGYKQIVETITPIQNDYEQIVVQQSYAQPYIYFLFFNKYDPAKYQQESHMVTGHSALDVGLVEHLDNIWFKYVDWSHERGQIGNLIVADTEKVPVPDSNDSVRFNVIQTINYLNGKDTAFRVIEIKQ